MVNSKPAIFWFRRDLRLHDNHALFRALNSGYKVQLLFIFDAEIIEELPKDDKRISLIYQELKHIHETAQKYNSSLLVAHGKPVEVFEKLMADLYPVAVYTNEDYEPYAIARDEEIDRLCSDKGVIFKIFQDQVIIHPKEVLKKDGKPYTVFTPWSKKWRAAFDPESIDQYPSEELLQYLVNSTYQLPDLNDIGFRFRSIAINRKLPPGELLKNYDENRNFPAKRGTSELSAALRFGIISIRELVLHARQFPVYLNELGWREFYMMILFHFPGVVKQAFKSQYDRIQWRNNLAEFELWKHGQTGYPIVDAGMRQLNETGYMHNRVRMITASFLTKHLLVDWRWGEAYFAGQLIDYELSSNNGGWQWAAGTGCDAAPYFRVFNPTLQTEKFDPDLHYIRKWVPEFDKLNYAQPVVNHKEARLRALETYKKALG